MVVLIVRKVDEDIKEDILLCKKWTDEFVEIARFQHVKDKNEFEDTSTTFAKLRHNHIFCASFLFLFLLLQIHI